MGKYILPDNSPGAWAPLAGVRLGQLNFTAGNVDMETVIKQYRDAFVTSFETLQTLKGKSTISFDCLDWTDAMAPQLAEAIAYANEHCAPSTRVHLKMGALICFSAEARARRSPCL